MRYCQRVPFLGNVATLLYAILLCLAVIAIVNRQSADRLRSVMCREKSIFDKVFKPRTDV